MAKKYRVGIIGHTGRGDYGHSVDVACRKVEAAEIVAVAVQQRHELANEPRLGVPVRGDEHGRAHRRDVTLAIVARDGQAVVPPTVEEVDAFVREQEEKFGGDPGERRREYELLQLYDRLSLYFCMRDV